MAQSYTFSVNRHTISNYSEITEYYNEFDRQIQIMELDRKVRTEIVSFLTL